MCQLANQEDIQKYENGQLDDFIDDNGHLEIPCGVEALNEQIYNYQNKNNIITVTVPDSVIAIGTYGFSQCQNLTTINLPDSLIYIGAYAFEYCESLQQIEIPDSVKIIGMSTFSYCTNLNYVKLSNQLEMLPGDLFIDCINLKTVIIPNSVKQIYGTFYRSGIEEIIIPQSVEQIKLLTFKNCTNLTNIVILNENITIELDSFIETKFEQNYTQLINSSGYIIDENYKYCDQDQYQYIYNLNTPDICIRNDYVYSYYIDIIDNEERKISTSYCPDNKPYIITSIQPYQCIDSCEQYTEDQCQLQDKQNKVFSLNSKNIEDYIEGDEQEILRVPEGTLIFGDGMGIAPGNQKNIKKIILPKTLQIVSIYSITTCVYSEELCDNIIEEIQFQSDVKLLDSGAFSNSYSLKNVTGLQNLQRISMSAFQLCENLEYIDTTDRIVYIGNDAFSECYKLQMIDISRVKYIGKSAFLGCNAIIHVDIPSITELWERIFSGCSNLQFINIPNTVISISQDAFDYCTQLQCVSIQNEDCIIDSSAFSNTPFETSYETLKNPNKRCFIDGYGYCNDTTTSYPYQAYYYDNLICTTESNVKYFYTQNNIKIRVSSCPDTYPYQYPSSPIQCLQSCIQPYSLIQDSKCVDQCSENYQLQNNICIFQDDQQEEQPQQNTSFSTENINNFINNNTLTIPEGITELTNEIYNYENKSQITSIIIPQSLKILSDYSLSGTGIQQITIPNTIEQFGDYIFFNCTNLHTVIIQDNQQYQNQQTNKIQFKQSQQSNNISQLGDYMFMNCINLKNVFLPQSLTYISEGMFYNCRSIEYIKIPENVIQIKQQAFNNCTSLKAINIPDFVQQIEDQAFMNCQQLECIYIGNQDCNISDNAFNNNQNNNDQIFSNQLCEVQYPQISNDGEDGDDNGDGSNIGMIIGIFIGVVVVICVIVVVSVCVCKKKQKQKKNNNQNKKENSFGRKIVEMN